MGRRGLAYLPLLSREAASVLPYRPRHAAPPRVLRGLLGTRFIQLLLPPAPVPHRYTAPAYLPHGGVPACMPRIWHG